MPSNHHSGLTRDEVKAALDLAMDVWKRGGCDCCAPNPLDEVWEDMTTEEAEQLRSFGIDLAYTGEAIIRYWEKEPESVS